MSTVTAINNFFNNALDEDVKKIQSGIFLTPRQLTIFKMYYLEKQQVTYIADTLNVCPSVINKELKIIRNKIIKLI